MILMTKKVKQSAKTSKPPDNVNVSGETKPEKPRSPKTLTFDCLPITQGKMRLVVFSVSAKQLWEIAAINKRDPDKDKGYQRVLSNGRVEAIKKYVEKGNAVPTSVLVTFDNGKISNDGRTLTVPNEPQAGWIIDGQHRLAGIHASAVDIELSVVAFVNLDLKQQIEQFVRVNKEAKNVPTSLYIDLLKHLPDKSDADLAKERASDIADALRKDEDSPFFGKIARVTSPKPGEISLVNFARKIAPLVLRNKGKLQLYSLTSQVGLIKNYYKALAHVFPDTYSPREGTSIFFKTLGFGALMNALPTVFDLCMQQHGSVRVEDFVKVFKKVDDFSFEDWDAIGTGTEAEKSAGDDLMGDLLRRFEAGDIEEGMDLQLE
jgi:DGQHR domain-containing protein